MTLFWIPLLIGILLEPTQGEDTKLLLVQTLFRHGARAPVVLYPTDPNPADYWKEGFGKLTLLGKRQHYALGTYFREMYRDFITTSPSEVTVNSSNSDRCIRSALANIAAFYKPSSEWKFDDTVDWQPIPVNTVPQVKDKYLSPEAHCPLAISEMLKIIDEKSAFMRAGHEEMMNNLTLLTGRNITNLMALFLLHDTLTIEWTHGLIIPPWVKYYWDELSSVAEEAFTILIDSDPILRLRIGPLLGRIVEDMVDKSAGGIPDIKVRLYSSHDYEVGCMLAALKVYNGIRPPFCAAVVFELHEKKDGEKVVRLLYLNSTSPEDVYQEPHLLVLDGCSEYCPLDYFVNFTKYVIPKNWKKECEEGDSTLTMRQWLKSILGT